MGYAETVARVIEASMARDNAAPLNFEPTPSVLRKRTAHEYREVSFKVYGKALDAYNAGNKRLALKRSRIAESIMRRAYALSTNAKDLANADRMSFVRSKIYQDMF